VRKTALRLSAFLVAAAVCVAATNTSAQNPTTTTGTTGTATVPQGTATTPATTPGTVPGTATPTDQAPVTGTTGADNTVIAQPDNTTIPDRGRGFPWGLLGLLGLLGLFRGRSTEVRRDTYATTSPGARTVGTGSAYDDRGNVIPRAASGTSTTGGPSGLGGTGGTGGTGGSGTMGDPNARR
jgi:hypothetical protein